MKKIYSIALFFCFAFAVTKAASYTVTIVGTSYSPATLSVSIGDVVTIQASSAHPLVQVDQSTWNAGGNTPMSGGWGVQTSDYTFTVTTANTIYYVCQIHVSMGMKGQIVVSGAGINEPNISLKELNLFPNPVQGSLKVKFELGASESVSVKMINVIGQEVNTLLGETKLEPGSYGYNFELPATISSGNYFIEVSAGNLKSVRKIMISK